MANQFNAPLLQYFDSSGNPLSGGLLYIYNTGTTTLTSIYSDSALAVPLTNPVVLNTSGFTSSDGATPCSIYWVSGTAVKMKLTSSTNSSIFTIDPIPGIDLTDLSSYFTAANPLLTLNIDKTLNIAGGGTNFKLNGTAISLSIPDSNGVPILKFTATTNAVNQVTITDNITGQKPSIKASGTDSTVGLLIDTQGADTLQLGTTSATTVSLGNSSSTINTLGTVTASKAINTSTIVTVVSATSTPIFAAASNSIIISGTTTITSFDTIAAGAIRYVTFSGILTLTHNATSLILPGGANITTAVGDTAIFQSLGSGNTRCLSYTQANSSISTIPQSLGGRLTLTTGVPVTTTDVTAATTVYYSPYKGNTISIYNGSSWVTQTFSEVSIAVPATTSTMYDVFATASGSTIVLNAVAWTNDTTRATAIVLQDGMYCKSGALTNRYLGSFRTTGVSGQTEDSIAKRYLWNNNNRVRKSMIRTETTGSWTYTTATIRQANASALNQLDFILGVSEDEVTAAVSVSASNSSANAEFDVLIGLDSTTTAVTNLVSTYQVTNSSSVIFWPVTSIWNGYPGAGRHTLTWLEYSAASGTTTWFGTNGVATRINAGITGHLHA